MWRDWLPALRMTLVMTVLTGILYPLAATGLAQFLFSKQANGSLVTAGGKVAGSSLIGQAFTRPEYFHPRPSAAGQGYDATASGGSNLGPTSAALQDNVKKAVAAYHAENPGSPSAVPADAVTASASGLDPQISPANAEAQVARVAAARHVDPARIRELVAAKSEGRDLGVLGEARVNVLLLNLALDERFPVGR